MAVHAVNTDTFQKEVLDEKGVVFVDFYADWCGPCKFTSPIIDELAESAEFKDTVKFVKIDVDQNQDLSGQYNVFSIPTFITFRDGKIVSQFSGAKDKGGFVSELKSAL